MSSGKGKGEGEGEEKAPQGRTLRRDHIAIPGPGRGQPEIPTDRSMQVHRMRVHRTLQLPQPRHASRCHRNCRSDEERPAELTGFEQMRGAAAVAAVAALSCDSCLPRLPTRHTTLASSTDGRGLPRQSHFRSESLAALALRGGAARALPCQVRHPEVPYYTAAPAAPDPVWLPAPYGAAALAPREGSCVGPATPGAGQRGRSRKLPRLPGRAGRPRHGAPGPRGAPRVQGQVQVQGRGPKGQARQQRLDCAAPITAVPLPDPQGGSLGRMSESRSKIRISAAMQCTGAPPTDTTAWILHRLVHCIVVSPERLRLGISFHSKRRAPACGTCARRGRRCRAGPSRSACRLRRRAASPD